MDILTLRRGLLALTGAVAGLSLWMLEDAALRGALSAWLELPLSTFALVFFGAVLALAGPVRLRRAVAMAAPLALLVAGLIALVALRYGTAAEVRMDPAGAAETRVLGARRAVAGTTRPAELQAAELAVMPAPRAASRQT